MCQISYLCQQVTGELRQSHGVWGEMCNCAGQNAMLLLFLWPKSCNMRFGMVGFGKSSVCTYVGIFCLTPVSRRDSSYHIYFKNVHEKIIDTEYSNKKICAKSTKINTYFCSLLAYVWESFGCLIIRSFLRNSTLIKITAVNEYIFKSFM